ncbi:unnamed protein product [Cunninghamella blakesleeana]
MSSFIHFVGHSSSEGPPTIIFQHEKARYMFNCREGTQRQCVEDKVKLSKLKSIFLSRTHWDCIGGLPGMLLTVTDAGVRDLNIYGGKNLTHFLVSTRHFVYRTTTKVQSHEFGTGTIDHYDDKILKVTPVLVAPSPLNTKKKRSFDETEEVVSSSSDYSLSSSESPLNDNDNNTNNTNINNEKNHNKDIMNKNNNSIRSTMTDTEYRQYVLSQMFSVMIKEGGDELVPEHTIEAACTPVKGNSKHPLANEASIQFVRKGKNQPSSKAIVTSSSPESESNDTNNINNNNTNDNNNNNNNNNNDNNSSNNGQSSKQFKYIEYLENNLPRTKPDKTSISYICQTPNQRGRFKTDKAKELGIPMGPLWGKLQKGDSVTLDDGRVITHDQVCDPDSPGSTFMIIDCPDKSYIDNLIASPEFKPYQSRTDHSLIPKVIIHLISTDILNVPKYREWMNSFSPETEHIIGGEGYCAQISLFRSHAFSQYKLSHLNSDIFRIPHYNNNPSRTLDRFNDLPKKVYPLANKTKYSLDTKKGLERYVDSTAPFDINNKDEAMFQFDQNEEVQRVIQKAIHSTRGIEINKPFPGDNIQIITLGTGSSIPSKYRNVSATLIKIPGFGSFLLDAGEGTYGQMLRYFSEANIEKELLDLRGIFVSHLHADHHLGVIHLLNKRRECKRAVPPIFIIGPYNFQRWLLEYNDVQHIGSNNKIRFIRCNHLDKGANKSPPSKTIQNLTFLKKTFGFTDIDTVTVQHCRWAYGLSLKHTTGWKLV